VKNGTVAILGSVRAEGKSVAQVDSGIAFLVVKLAGEFFERLPEWFLERRARMLSEGFMGDQDGEQIGLGQGRLGQASDGFGVIKSRTGAGRTRWGDAFPFQNSRSRVMVRGVTPRRAARCQGRVAAGADQMVYLAKGDSRWNDGRGERDRACGILVS